ncbi:g888 [Coccomyxa viridis]|uniref:G888 protein n=1 Tax=Coccomyxa viridis TaxID=1274662 RepID=A0ABP1FGR5_9CHLO
MQHSQQRYPQRRYPQQPGQYPPQYPQEQPNSPAAPTVSFMPSAPRRQERYSAQGQFALGPGAFGVAVIPIQKLGFAGPEVPNPCMPRPMRNTGQQQLVRKSHKRGIASKERYRERRNARRAKEREVQGHQDNSAAPGTGLVSKQAEGIPASCPVCSNACPHRASRFSCLDQLPDDLCQEKCTQETWELWGSMCLIR